MFCIALALIFINTSERDLIRLITCLFSYAFQPINMRDNGKKCEKSEASISSIREMYGGDTHRVSKHILQHSEEV